MKQRDFGLDLVRCAACVLVLSALFFSSSGFYQQPLSGKSMLVSAVVRMACMTCAPMFILLTGYLCIERTWSVNYYWKFAPILLTYLLAGLACMVFRILWRGEQFSPGAFILEFTSFNASPYAWYIEMYIGLFLLAPFFNAAWRSLDKKGRAALTLSLAALTSVSPVLNRFAGLWPDWWESLCPFTCYAVGAWLREYPIRAKRRWLLLGWAGTAVAAGLWCYISCHDKVFAQDSIFLWTGTFCLIQAVLLFSALRQCGGARVPAPVRWCVSRIAGLSLGICLVSYIPDRLVYPLLNKLYPIAHRRILWMPVVVAMVLLYSCLLAQLVGWTAAGLMKLLPTEKKEPAQAAKES